MFFYRCFIVAAAAAAAAIYRHQKSMLSHVKIYI
jgi:hypothetical protein